MSSRILMSLLILALVLAGCGGPYVRQAKGDPDGVAMQIEVQISHDYVRDLRNRGPGGREYVAYSSGFYGGWWGGYRGYGACPPGYRYPYDPFWTSDVYWAGPAPTTVYLLGGDGPGQARLMRTELDYGTNLIDLTVRPGRQVTLTLQAYGGYEGWEEIGRFTAADRPGQRVVIDLKEHAPQLRIFNPDGTMIDVPPKVPPAVAPAIQAPAAPAPGTTAPAPGTASPPATPGSN